MEWFSKYFLKMDEAGDGKGGGGGGGKPDPKPNDDVASLKAQNDALIKRLEALEAAGKPPKPEDDPSLADKARQKREEDERKAGDSKRLEGALKFTLTATEWVKTNESLLPKTIEGIFTQAEKENYGSAVEKADAIKVGIVSEFFSLQTNLDLLTESQKNSLENFKKLTKTDKQDRVGSIYETVFEPTFEMLKRIKKAEQINKGLGDSSDSETAYKNKMKALSKKHYLKEGI